MYHPRAERPRAKLAAMAARFDRYGRPVPLFRCFDCNAPVEAETLEAKRDMVPPRARRELICFFRCTGHGKVYREGTHVRGMRALIDRIMTLRPANGG